MRGGGPLQSLGGLEVEEVRPQGLALRTRGARIDVGALAPDLFRFRAAPGRRFSPRPSWAVSRSDWPPAATRVSVGRRVVRVRAAGGGIELDLRNGRLRVANASGCTLAESGPKGPGFLGRQAHLAFRLSGREAFFGLGESSGPFDRRGLVQEFWNTDALGHGGIHPGLRALYVSIPFTVMLAGGRPFGLFWDNPARQRWDLGQADRRRWQLTAASGEIDLYLFTGASVADIVRRYSELTGRMPMPPRWALGYHQCRYSYRSREEVEHIARQLRRRRIPCDVLYLDIHHMRGFRVFTFGRAFRKPAEMIARLRRRGFQTVAITDPGVKVDSRFGVYKRGRQIQAYVRTPDGRRDYVGKVWPGRTVFPDFLNARVRRWWGREQSGLQRRGVVGIWNDMNEPANFVPPSKTLPERCRHESDSGPVSHAEAHNVYGMQMARASREGASGHRPDRRPFVITRAAYAGTQRYAMLWTGDNASSWEQLADSVQMLLNLGLSGFPFCGSDAGGFLDNCTPELYARWMQMAAFTPFFRNHTMLGTQEHEPWSFGPEIEAIVRGAVELRYQLLPYWYCLFAEAHRSGTPIMRPLLWQYPEDPVAVGCGDQFLVGPSLLVAPILRQGAMARAVYLPHGTWFDFWTGRRHRGGAHIVAEAPLPRLPLYVAGGSLVPMAALCQHTGRIPDETIHLHLWPDGIGRLEWYEDDGLSPRHERGAFHQRRISWDGKTLHFGPAEGEYPSRLKHWRILLRNARRAIIPSRLARKARFDPEARVASCLIPNPGVQCRVEMR